MLRSYEYTEQSYSDVRFQSDLLRDKEIHLAECFGKNIKQSRSKGKVCPVCEKETGNYFYTKWGVDYLLCNECGSVYASCKKEEVDEYKKYDALLELRRSEIYQQEVTERRQQYWKDFLEWMQIRTFRFMKKNKGLSIIDVGNRYLGFTDAIKKSELCGQYCLTDSILENVHSDKLDKAELIFYLDQMQNEIEPVKKLKEMYDMLETGGLLVLGTRAGSGFDILTLKEHNLKIYPYEHVVLPSVQGLVSMLKEAGYKILEITTPGIMDIQYVKEVYQLLDDSNVFIKNLMQAQDSVLQEFQRFLQKNSMSSFVRVIATKEKKHA